MRLSILLLTLVLFSCGGGAASKDPHAGGSDPASGVRPVGDSALAGRVRPAGDSDSAGKARSAGEARLGGGDDDPEPGLEQIMADYQRDCRDTVRIDTQVFYMGKDFRIRFRHYCTNDSLLELPKNILDIYKLKKLTTSNFVSSLVVRSRDSVVLDTIIRSDLFYRYADPHLRTYGVLFYGGRQFLPGRLNIDYSLSIPLSDVGIGVHLSYALGGGLTTAGNEPAR